jgi:hypothetical protein
MTPRPGALGVLACLFSLALVPGHAGAADSTTVAVPPRASGLDPNVRSTAPDLQRLIEYGASRSTSFRSLLTRLNASDVVVYVRCEFPMSDSTRYNGKLSFLSQVGRRRFLLVQLRCPVAGDLQILYLAHELRHAVEIADAPQVRDQGTMLEFYRRVGFPSVADSHWRRAFETEAARDAQQAVREELRDCDDSHVTPEE